MPRLNRRQFLCAATAAPSALMGLQACSPLSGHELGYEEKIRETWRHTGGTIGDDWFRMRELVRYATLAPSSHNTQCWKFLIWERAVYVLPDQARRCPVVDPDDHHLFVSLGCATENLLQAALANGLKGEARFAATEQGSVSIALEATKAVASPMYEAIPKRQCTRADYDGKPLSNAELKLLEAAGTGDGVRVLLLTEPAAMENVLDYVVQGNTAQLNDPAFVKELKTWIRFSNEEAVSKGDGLYSVASGNPSIPRWMGSPLLKLFLSAESENAKYIKQIRSSAGIAIFVAEAADKAHWVEVGRCYERFALQATALGIRNAMLNQALEVSDLRPQFAGSIGIGKQRPDLVVRFGRGPEMPRSLRRPLQAVLA